MAYIENRKNAKGEISYRAQVRMKGEKPINATFKRLTDARKWIQQTEAAIREGRYFRTSEAKRHTVAELVDRYMRDILPRKKNGGLKQKHQLLWWKEKLGYKTLADLTPSLLTEYKDLLKQEKTPTGILRSPSTANRYLAVLSHALSIAAREWEWIEVSPMLKVSKEKEPRGIVRFLLPNERKALLDACKASRSPVLYVIVVLALSTGARMGELLGLKWEDVNFRKRKLIFRDTKNGETRSVPLVSTAYQVLIEYANKRNTISQLLFPSKKLNSTKPIDIRKPWVKALKIAGIKNFRQHDMRHSCASELAMNNASLTEIAEVLGHKTLTMVKRYSHLSEDHTASILEKMNDKIFEGR